VVRLQNKTKFLLVPFLMLILVGMGVNHAYAITLSDSVKQLGMPEITINPESGPVGTVVTINVSSLPMPPNGADPRLEFYMYLPASEDYGAALTKCGGHCIMLYSFDDIRNGELYPKEITFALPSEGNSDPYSVQLSLPLREAGKKQSAVITSACDVVINGKIEYRLGYSCNNYNAPVGEYEIDFGWAVGMAGVYDKSQTVTFTVTDEPYQPKGFSYDSVEVSSVDWSAGSSDLIFKKFEQGELTKTEFLAALKTQGWETDDDIRRALALVGELEHQKELVLVEGTSKVKTIVPVVENDSNVDNNSNIENQVESSIQQTSSENIEDTSSTVVYAVVIGGVVLGVAIFAAFGRNWF